MEERVMKNDHKPGLLISESMIHFLFAGTDEDAGILIRTLIKYNFDKEEPTFSSTEQEGIFRFFKSSIDENQRKYFARYKQEYRGNYLPRDETK
ncbi:hypothetical protein M2133_000666 [Parabacteroides sp. PF5-6]|nr:hypothetical protein [Parabacteroides sp. PF5-6]